MSVSIIYEDNHLLIVEKPVNMPVQEDASGDMDLLNHLKNDLKIRYNKPGEAYLGLVHRLDRPVGGVMVFAKTSKAASRLADALRQQELEREYLAVVYGKVSPQSGQLEDYLWKDRGRNIVHVTDSKRRNTKKAVLNYEVVAVADEMSLVRVQLETGRSHQIRVQLKHFGHPLYGDQKYGDNRVEKHTQIALWAHKLTLPHPTKKDRMTFESVPNWEIYPWSVFAEEFVQD